MELLKFTNMAPDFYPSSRRINGRDKLYCLPIGATKKMGKKTSHVVNFIVSMALTFMLCCGLNLGVDRIAQPMVVIT